MVDLLSQLIEIRAQPDAKYAVERLNDILKDLAEEAPATTANGNAQASPRTCAMLIVMRLRNCLQQKGMPFEIKVRWDEAIAAARQFDKPAD